MAKYFESLELEQAEKLLDVIFGVVIGLALIKLPEISKTALKNMDQNDFLPPVLLLSALLFCAFYWLEVRYFLSAQKSFKIAISGITQYSDDTVPMPLATFLLGSLLMMTLASGSLTFAIKGEYRAFLTANVLFWTCDLGGTFFLKHGYRKFKSDINIIKEKDPVDHGWFLGHIISNYFYIYGLGNTVFFAALFYVDFHWLNTDSVRLFAAFLIVAFTLFRHLLWRSRIYSWWLNKHVLHRKNSEA
ncbi:hypothetical protein ACFL0O_05285 [Thermodesulfobacteriota bacterium]